MVEAIRHVTQDEMSYLTRISEACWPEPFESAQTKAMPHFVPATPQDVLVLSLDGQPVSCVAYPRRELMIGETTVHFGSLGYVATRMEYQRRGYASRLMVESVREMSERGDHVSGLFSFSFGYYRRFGWEVSGDCWQLLILPAEFGWEEFSLPTYNDYEKVRPFRAADLEGISLLYDAHLQQRGWGLTRPPAYWEWAAGWLNRENCFVCEGDNGLEGYLVAEVTPHLQLPDEFVFRRTDDPLWPVDIGPVFHIMEMVAATPTARHALVGYLARRSREVAALAYPLACRSDLESCGFLVPPARVRLMPSFMFRVINVTEAVRALADLPAPEESFSLAVSDPLGLNAEPLAIYPSNGRPEAAVGRREKHHLEMDIQAFSQMFAGYRSAASLWALGRLRASSKRAIGLADQVFILREPFMGELDLF